MRRVICILMGALAVLCRGGEPVGVPADSVTVPLETVTVSADSITVSEAEIRCRADAQAFREELIAIVRGNRPESERLAALDSLWDQDDLFYLFFKPGDDRSVAVRVAAAERLAEVDVVKAVGGKVRIKEVSETIKRRVDDLYLDAQDRSSDTGLAAFRRYAARLRSRK